MFTMAEYIAEHKLGVSPQDPRASKVINAHLLRKGYVRIRRGGKHVYVPAAEVADIPALEAKLKELK